MERFSTHKHTHTHTRVKKILAYGVAQQTLPCVSVWWKCKFCTHVGFLFKFICCYCFFVFVFLHHHQGQRLDAFPLWSDSAQPPVISPRQINIANTAGHITSPTSKAASWKAQWNISRDLQPSSLCFRNMLIQSNLPPPLAFFVFYVWSWPTL